MLRELIGRPSNKYKIEYNSLQSLKRIVLKHLNVRDMNKLRDRFEGQKYLNSFLTKSFAELAFEKIIGKEIVSWEQKEEEKGYKPSLEIDGMTVDLITADFESYPLIPKSEYDIGIVVFVNIDTRDTIVLGYADRQTLIANANTSNLSPVFETSYFGHLKNFDILKPINTVIEV